MFNLESRYDRVDFYASLERELFSLIEGEKNIIANLANICSWIFHSIPELNWCGFYLWDEKDQELVLGPFQGKPACIRILSGKGVCGTAYQTKKSLRVDDVKEFPGHISCDPISESELVLPLIKEDRAIGVLDLDSPKKSRFSENDEKELNRILNLLAERIFI